MKTRIMTVEIQVEVPANVGESAVEQEINAALDEPPCDWEGWTVGAARITNVKASTKKDLK